ILPQFTTTCISTLILSKSVFQCSTAHRGIPSFPTRRSSDLEGDAQYGDVGLGGEAVTAGGRIEGPPDLCLLITAVLEPETDVAEDRKSTRLNSSHVSISYAVFCLKKKK